MKKKPILRRVVTWTLLLALVAALVILPRLARSRAEASSAATLLSARAERGDLTGALSGGGTLKADKPLEITVPDGVEITGYLVGNGEHVAEGKALATVNPVTVMAAAVEVQKTMETLTEKIHAAANDKATATLTAAAPGRVKAVFVKSGDDVTNAMLTYGCLAVISLDGLMAVEFDTEAPLRVGQRLRIRVEGGKTYDGRVETILEGRCVATLTDNGPKLGDAVTITDSDGNAVGSGSLTVHSPLRIIAESGTVSKIMVKQDAKIGKGAKLLSLKDMDPSAEYESLSAKRQKYADILQELFALYRDGVVKAPGGGYVIDIDETLVKNVRAGEGDFRVVLLDNETPDSKVPDGATNEVAVVTAVQNGAAMLVNLGPVQVTDYADLSSVGVDLNTIGSAAQAQPVVAPTYYWDKDKGWQPYGALQSGDVVLIASDSTGRRLIFVRHINLPIEDIEEEARKRAEEEARRLEEEARKRINDMIGSLPYGSFNMPNFSFSMPKLPTQEEEEELYPLEGTKIGSLVPDEGMKISFPVDEMDILRYTVGMEAEITVDALPGRTFTGTVTEIGSIGTSNGGNSKYTVTVAFDRSGDMLDGMNASVSVHTGSAEGVTIPAAALYDSGSATYVYTALDRSGTAPDGRREVTVGMSDGEMAQILSGLDEGETVWYVYYADADEENPPRP